MTTPGRPARLIRTHQNHRPEIPPTALSALVNHGQHRPRCTVIAGMRLPAGRVNSDNDAARIIAQVQVIARPRRRVTGRFVLRGDSAYGNVAVATACRCARESPNLIGRDKWLGESLLLHRPQGGSFVQVV